MDFNIFQRYDRMFYYKSMYDSMCISKLVFIVKSFIVRFGGVLISSISSFLLNRSYPGKNKKFEHHNNIIFEIHA